MTDPDIALECNRKALYALELMLGNGVWNLHELKHILNGGDR